MKLLTRTTIVLIIVNLLIGNSAQSQETPEQRTIQPTARSESAPPSSPATEPSALRPAQVPEPVPVPEPIPVPESVPAPMPAPPRPGRYDSRTSGWSQIRGREVLVIPATDIKAEELAAITEDLQVMSHIFDEKFKEPQEIQGVFIDFGDIFGRDSRSTEAIYIQGYGVLFLMEVNFAFSPEPKTQEKQAEETKYADPTWQRARRKILSPPGLGGSEFVQEEKYSADKIDQLKTELTRTLKHTANIRNIQPEEWVILTVIGKARQSSGMYQYKYYGNTPPGTGTSRSRRRSSSSSRGSYGGGGAMGGGMMGGMGGGTGMGGDGFGGGMMMGRGMMGGMGMGAMYGEDYSEAGSPSTTVLTIRTKKMVVDAFAKGDIDFEKFQEKVDIFMY